MKDQQTNLERCREVGNMSVKKIASAITWPFVKAIAFTFSIHPDPGIYYGMTSCVNYQDIKQLGKNCERIVSELLSEQ